MPTFNVFVDTTNDFSKSYSLSYFETPLGKDYSKRNITMSMHGGEVFCTAMRKRDYLNPCKVLGAVRFTHWIEQTRNVQSEQFFMNSVQARDMLSGGKRFMQSMRVYDTCHELEEVDGGGHSKPTAPTHWKYVYLGQFGAEKVFILDDEPTFNPTDSLKTQTSTDLLNPMTCIEETDAPELTLHDQKLAQLKTDLSIFRFTPLGNLSDIPIGLKYKDDGTAVFYVNYGLAKLSLAYRNDVKRFAEFIDEQSVIPIKHHKLSATKALDILSFSKRIESGMINFVGAKESTYL